jgi:hypothetical protein
MLGTTLFNNQKVATTKVSINRGMDKQNMVYPYNATVFSYTKE